MASLLLLALLATTAMAADIDQSELMYRPMINIIGANQRTPTNDVPVSLGKPATTCDPKKCKLPNCQCSTTKPPNNMTLNDIPQMVVFTFQNALSDQNYQHYLDLFSKRKNPNGCPAVGTFYVTHNHTDYFEVQSLWAAGHEMGDNTVTSQPPVSYWSKATYDIWKAEIRDQAQILNQWAQLPNQLPAGFRAPYLQLGGDEEYTALRDSKILYEASRTSIKYTDPDTGFLWPYTYDYASIQDCVIGRCPVNAYPGLWQLPLAALKDKNNTPCSTLDACFVENEQDVYDLLMKAFLQHYTKSRAPYVLTVGTAWMVTPFKKSGTLKFLDAIKSYKNMYLVSGRQAIQWSQNPTTVAKLPSFKPWSCRDLPHQMCDVTKASQCYYDANRKQVKQGGVFRFRTCVTKCPACYPMVNDPFGKTC